MNETNRTDAARALLNEIEAWCDRTNTREGVIGHVLFLHPGFVGLLRKRLTLSVDKELAVREFIYCRHPDGYHADLPLTHGNGTKPLRSSRIRLTGGAVQARRRGGSTLPAIVREPMRAALPRVDRDPCPRCGVRADVGCAHSRNRLGMVL